MPRQTAKYSAALKLANSLGISSDDNQESLYASLNSHSYYWNSKSKQWDNLSEDADAPSELIRIRLWVDSRFIDLVAQDCIDSFAKNGLRCIERSEAYPCRPPKQLESRLYLSFIKEPEKSDRPQSTDVVLGLGRPSERSPF